MTYELSKGRGCNILIIVPLELKTAAENIICIDNS